MIGRLAAPPPEQADPQHPQERHRGAVPPRVLVD